MVWAAIGVACVLGQTQQAQAQSVELGASTALHTTYVFRGVPQYVGDDNPTLQLGLDVALKHGSGFWWGEVWAATSLQQRDTNSRRGSGEEVNIALGYTWQLHPSLTWTLGGIEYLRPSNEPINYREELMTNLFWDAYEGELATVSPYVAAFGEVHRLLGVYVEVGAHTRVELGDGFVLSLLGFAGGAQYAEDTVDSNLIGGTVALTYNISAWPGLSITGHLSPSLSQENIGVSGNDFIDRHGFLWSGLVLRYTAIDAELPATRRRTLGLGFQAIR